MANNIAPANLTAPNNDLVQQILAEPEQAPVKAEITAPSDVMVTFPAGYINSAGEVITTAEVRELTGKDEEYILKSGTIAKAYHTLLERAVVKVGNEPVTESLLDQLLIGDRDALMLGIYRATFGDTAELPTFCDGCETFKSVALNVVSDIATKILVDPIADRNFIVKGRKHEYLVTLPTGTTQREIVNNTDKTRAELETILFNQCVLEIDGNPIIGKAQVQNIGLQDRRAISQAITDRNPGPQLDDTTITCPDCGGEVVVPISVGALFRF